MTKNSFQNQIGKDSSYMVEQVKSKVRGKLCGNCNTQRAVIKLPRDGSPSCRECFYTLIENRVHNLITSNNLFPRGSKVIIGASGGKDSTVLAYILKVLNDRHDYGLDLQLLAIDEGITGYRDDSLDTVKRNEVQYGIPLTILSYKDLYEWTMDDIVKLVGLRNNCTFCGVFRRLALDRGAALLKGTHLVTGHNADDIAETVVLNFMRGDVARLKRCTSIETTSDVSSIRRSKVFKDTFEKEIVMYAYFKKLDYFSTECTYFNQAARAAARSFIKELEKIRPTAILDIIKSGDAFATESTDVADSQSLGTCEKCGYMSSQAICKACVLLEGLNSGMPMLAVGKKSYKVSKMVQDAARLVAANGETEGKECDGQGGCGRCANGTAKKT